jgi:hypothetical protein
MIRLGLRLTLGGGREAAARLVVTAIAVALGVGMLLAALACLNALNAQNGRAKWLDSGEQSTSSPSGSKSASDPLWWILTADQFGNQTIDRVDLAATGPDSPVPPGIAHLPGPGQYYASPALSKLIRDTPANQLGDRFPGKQIGTIGDSALTGPDALVIVIGHSASQLSHAHYVTEVTSIVTPAAAAGGTAGVENSATLKYIFIAAACALLFPVLTFIGTATRLAAARREQRFAAMRLVGATPRQVSVIAAVEASLAAVGGVAVGFGLFFLLRPALTTADFTSEPFFPGDLSPGLADILLVAIGIPAAAAVAAHVALRRVQIAPLGVSQRVTPRALRAWRVIPLLAGIAELSYFAVAGNPGTTGGQAVAFFLGFLLLMTGLIIAGPWLMMAGARVMARRPSSPAMLIAGRRVSDNPRAAFRAISGLILALFVTGTAVGVITTLVDDHGGGLSGSTLARETLLDQASYYAAPGKVATTADPIPEPVLAKLRSIRGVQAVTVIRADPRAAQNANPYDTAGLVSCAQLAQDPALGRCPPGASVALVTADFTDSVKGLPSQRTAVWPAAAISPGRLARLPVQLIAVRTNGSSAAIEQARTVLDLASPYLGLPATVDQLTAAAGAQIAAWQREAEIVIIASLPIAGCSLAVSVAAGLTDRKRPFSLLRLTGVPLGMLRRVVALESAVPLVVIAVISAGTGLLGAALFLRSQFDVSFQPPGMQYYLIVLAGLVVSLGIIASTLPLLQRITGPEVARNE